MKIDRIRTNIRSKLAPVFSQSSYRSLLDKLNDSGEISDSMKKKLFKDAKRLSLKWNESVDYKLLSFSPLEITVMDILKALQPKYFFSHHSALYFHGVTNQRPEDYYLSREISGRIPPHSKDIVPARIRQAFTKDSRRTSKYFEFKKTRITLLEKQDLKRYGVIKQTLNHSDKTMNGRDIYLTSIERTLVDSIISPQYSGGLKNVIAAFDQAKFDLKKLHLAYQVYNTFYPYWQTIGFILKNFKTTKMATDWQSYFEPPAIDFFIDRNTRSDWVYCPIWKIYYPEGILK